MRSRHSLAGMALAGSLTLLMACSWFGGGDSSKRSGSGAGQETSGQYPPAEPQSMPAGPPPGAYGAGRPGMGSNTSGYGGNNPYSCIQTAKSRQEMSDCWRRVGDNANETARMCKNMMDSASEKDRANMQQCATQGATMAQAYYCVADEMAKPDTVLDKAMKGCMEKYHIHR